jgi:uncharacterized protein YcfJ
MTVHRYRRHVFVLAAVIALGLGAAHAGPPRYESGPGYRWARVVEVTPVYVRSSEPIYRQECFIEARHEVYEPGYHRRPRHAHSAPILGAIVGGLIGNQFGDGSGRAASTFAGVVLGDALARDAMYSRNYVPPRGHMVEREVCRDVPTRSYRETRMLDGYEVAYEYGGEIYHTRTDYDPGDRIQVRVDVRPRR